MQRAQLIRKLVLDSQYVIDEHLLAGAILARATVRGLIGDVAFRNDSGGSRQVRSFGRDADVRSFRPYAPGMPLRGRGGTLHLGLM
ncbi:MAG TPA: hypothetical protein VMB05_10335 [Solirubrobacteraceae bacterium]|nr:hypothetical protein [Solirubrobacteraceae bacterium]